VDNLFLLKEALVLAYFVLKADCEKSFQAMKGKVAALGQMQLRK
jgi:hypothetical protein